MNGFKYLYKSQKKRNKNINFSQEQVINQAINLHLKSNIKGATKNYQHFINPGNNDYRFFANYGVLFKDLSN